MGEPTMQDELHCHSILDKYEDTLWKNANVCGIGCGIVKDIDHSGVNGEGIKCCIDIFVKDITVNYRAKEEDRLPTMLEGIPVKLIDTNGGVSVMAEGKTT